CCTTGPRARRNLPRRVRRLLRRRFRAPSTPRAQCLSNSARSPSAPWPLAALPAATRTRPAPTRASPKPATSCDRAAVGCRAIVLSRREVRAEPCPLVMQQRLDPAAGQFLAALQEIQLDHKA